MRASRCLSHSLVSIDCMRMPAAKASSSNWSKLKTKIVKTPDGSKKRKRTDIEDLLRAKASPESETGPASDILGRPDECE